MSMRTLLYNNRRMVELPVRKITETKTQRRNEKYNRAEHDFPQFCLHPKTLSHPR